MLNNEKIVYFLGAGFSAPFGLPVMSNFIERSKDMYFSDRERYSSFGSVYKLINEFSRSKNFYSTDLHNIEEVLSILETKLHVDGADDRELFQSFICEVIEHYTPSIDFSYDRGSTPSNWEDVMWGTESLPRSLGVFVANLVGMTLLRGPGDSALSTGVGFKMNPVSSPGSRYAVISMNYDLLLEQCWHSASERFHSSAGMGFLRSVADGWDENRGWADGKPFLAKLHGSVDGEAIVPPTWNKSVDKTTRAAWKAAFRLLTEANHIRFIGYSLPTADAYVKYLLKAAAIAAPHLKSLDVICLDPEGDVKARYDSFISFPKYRFFNATLEKYLDGIDRIHKKAVETDGIRFDQLETQHRLFTEKH